MESTNNITEVRKNKIQRWTLISTKQPAIPNAPKVGDEWNIEDEEDVYQLIDQSVIGRPAEYGFESEEELANYVLGREGYQGQRSFRPGERDKSEQEDILHKLSPKCPRCLEKIHEYLENGAMRGEINKDPNLEVSQWEEDRESYRQDIDEVTERYVVAYCPEHDDEAFISFQETIR